MPHGNTSLLIVVFVCLDKPMTKPKVSNKLRTFALNMTVPSRARKAKKALPEKVVKARQRLLSEIASTILAQRFEGLRQKAEQEVQ